MNWALRVSQLGYVRAISKFKLDEGGIRDHSVQPAYARQELCQYGFPFANNRRGQTEFHRLWCGFQANADGNAAGVLAERFGDAELEACLFRNTGTVFALSFMRCLPDNRSASAGLELQPCSLIRVGAAFWLSIGKAVVDAEPLPIVNQPGYPPCHRCL